MEPTLSASEAAAREALEEAGATGSIEESYFDCYLDTKKMIDGAAGVREIMIAAFLLEVGRTTPPEETHRNPTWFAPAEAKERLAERRSTKYHGEFARVIDRAVKRVSTKKQAFRRASV